MTGFTISAPGRVKAQFDQFYFTEQGIKGSQRASCTAKRTTGENCPDHKNHEDKKFVKEKKS